MHYGKMPTDVLAKQLNNQPLQSIYSQAVKLGIPVELGNSALSQLDRQELLPNLQEQVPDALRAA